MYRAGISADRVREIIRADDASIMTWGDVFAERDTLRAEVERLRHALERVNSITKTYADDCRGMPEYSTLVVAEIARKALGATK